MAATAPRVSYEYVPMPACIWTSGLHLTAGEFQLLGYLLHHQFRSGSDQLVLSNDEMLNGVRSRGVRIDQGCGLSANTLKDARERLILKGWLAFEHGSKTYVLTIGEPQEASETAPTDCQNLTENRQKLMPVASEVDEKSSEIDTLYKEQESKKKEGEKGNAGTTVASPPPPVAGFTVLEIGSRDWALSLLNADFSLFYSWNNGGTLQGEAKERVIDELCDHVRAGRVPSLPLIQQAAAKAQADLNAANQRNQSRGMRATKPSIGWLLQALKDVLNEVVPLHQPVLAPQPATVASTSPLPADPIRLQAQEMRRLEAEDAERRRLIEAEGESRAERLARINPALARQMELRRLAREAQEVAA